MTSTYLRLIFSSHQFIKIRKDFLLNTCKYQVIFIYLQQNNIKTIAHRNQKTIDYGTISNDNPYGFTDKEAV